MTLDYYLVDKQHGRIFDVGSHRQCYNLALRMALTMNPKPPKGLFCLACGAYWSGWAERFPSTNTEDGYDEPWWAGLCAARHAANIHDFCVQADWNMVLVNDCDDSLFEYDHLPKTHTIYTLSKLNRPSYEGENR